jgi:hypothetical protein
MSKCFTANKLALYLEGMKIIKLITNIYPQYQFFAIIKYICKTTEIRNSLIYKLITNHKKWKNQVDQTTPKLYGACYIVRSEFHISNTATLKKLLILFSLRNEIWNISGR